MSLPLTLHLLAAVVWVGGMFFAYVVLRPTAAAQLEPPLRLALWAGVFGRFFPWVWAAVILLPLTGYWILFGYFGGWTGQPLHVMLMQATGWPMIALFAWLFLAPWPALRRAVAAQDWKAGGAALNRIRRIVGINLALGLLTVAVASGGKFLAG